jgi:hypothetical protein
VKGRSSSIPKVDGNDLVLEIQERCFTTVHSTQWRNGGCKGDHKKKKCRVVTDYKDTKGGVDLVGQHLSNYPVPGKQG